MLMRPFAKGSGRLAYLMPTRRGARIGLLALVVAYGALLRLDALTLTYGVVERPSWLRSLQSSRGPESVVRPSGFRWQRSEGRYISDPVTYLKYAREMRSFYAAHGREPLYPLATKISLRLLSDQDIAVSFTSMFFSVLAIVGTFLLGSYAFSYWVGLGAAAAMAIEYDVVTWGVGGWRDDAFTAVVVFCALAMLRYARIGSAGAAVALGAIAGIACLVRITSLSFLLPGLVWAVTIVRGPWTVRARHATLMVLTAGLIAAPYFVNCWRTYGNPFWAIDIHTAVYRETEGETAAFSQTAAQYVSSKFRSRPWQSVDTAVLGLTEYPFTNKWQGFNAWHSELGKLLSWAALIGLLLFVGSREGRLLLMVLAASLVPYMITWKLIHDWRFTLHAYPFFLTAAAYAIATAARVGHPQWLRARLSEIKPSKVAGWTAAALIVGTGVWITQRILPVVVAKETLRHDEAVSVIAGARDGAFLAGGWGPPETAGNVTARVNELSGGTISLPLPEMRDYRLTIRLDPFPGPSSSDPEGLPWVHVAMNGRLVRAFEMTWNHERVGAYTVVVPKHYLNAHGNVLHVSALTKRARRARVRWWYVRIQPWTRS